MNRNHSAVPELPRAFPKLLDERRAAALIGVAPSTLAIWRSTNRYALPYIKCGRLVRYREDDIIAFLEQRRVVIGQEGGAR